MVIRIGCCVRRAFPFSLTWRKERVALASCIQQQQYDAGIYLPSDRTSYSRPRPHLRYCCSSRPLPAMDSTLKCNDLKCRIPCPEQAVVTTCSHIFCVNCAARLGLIEQHPNEGPRTCPACYTQLVNPDDAVVTALNPSEDYKTSILSGLSPAVIMVSGVIGGAALRLW